MFTLGTGATLIDQICHRVLEEVQHELIFVTCFWATSHSLDSICHLLRQLSSSAIRCRRIIRVRIGFSSLSLLQKLTHTRSEDGYIYSPTECATKLGLPPPNELRGLDLQVKSLFVLPFSVMHPKYVIADRRTAFLPSCNVSWEDWFEGCFEFQGSTVADLFQHWQVVWGRTNFAVSAAPDELTSSSVRNATEK